MANNFKKFQMRHRRCDSFGFDGVACGAARAGATIQPFTAATSHPPSAAAAFLRFASIVKPSPNGRAVQRAPGHAAAYNRRRCARWMSAGRSPNRGLLRERWLLWHVALGAAAAGAFVPYYCNRRCDAQDGRTCASMRTERKGGCEK